MEKKNVVEAVDIGDADNDGRNEACIATDHVHIIGWNGVKYYEEAAINETYGILPDVHVGDCDNDGKNELLTETLRETEGLPHKVWIFKYANSDATPPILTVEKPGNYLYIFGKEILPMPLPVILGKFTAYANAEDKESGIKRLNFMLMACLKRLHTLHPINLNWEKHLEFMR